MNKDLIKGTIIGVIAPAIAFVIYVGFYLDADVIDMYHSIVKMNKLTHVMSLSVLVNLLLFFMHIKTNKDTIARGILLATLLYGLLIAVLKFI